VTTTRPRRELAPADVVRLGAEGSCVQPLVASGATARARELAERSDRAATDAHMPPHILVPARANRAVATFAADPAAACALAAEAQELDAPRAYSPDRAGLAKWRASRCKR
jgi:hypothetical protein